MSDAPSSRLPMRDITPGEGPGGESCTTCAAGYFKPGADMGGCRLNPPTISHVVMPAKDVITGQIMPQVQPWASWPAVKRDQWCVTGFIRKVTQ